jgi:hypothetical protein
MLIRLSPKGVQVSEFDLKAAREWVDAHPTVTSVNVNAYVAALDEISRIRPVYEAAKAMQIGIGGYDRAVFKRVNAVCVAVETAEGVPRFCRYCDVPVPAECNTCAVCADERGP